jgi:tRNA G18 (ribose-2'-O)-methylase SpoU
MSLRPETRRERYQAKQATAKRHPVSVVACNFTYDGNIAFLARALACFGGDTLHIIGRVPSYAILTKLSGGTSNLCNIQQHSSPFAFLDWLPSTHTLLTAELTDEATNLHVYRFPTTPVIIGLGHESIGIPIELTRRAKCALYVPMDGPGFCLNTSQAGNVLLYEYTRQMSQSVIE